MATGGFKGGTHIIEDRIEGKCLVPGRDHPVRVALRSGGMAFFERLGLSSLEFVRFGLELLDATARLFEGSGFR